MDTAIRSTSPITPDQTLADLAVTRAGASRVFRRHGLDFCCHGRIALADACAPKGLSADALIREIEDEERVAERFARWDRLPLGDLVDHIVHRYHEPLRPELFRLVEMAARVENVHREKATCPTGLAAVLAQMRADLEQHMEEEEQRLFPLVRDGRGVEAAEVVRQLETEHEDAGRDLLRLRALTRDLVPPPEACGTWKALYLGLAELENELMQHIHLENNVLFPRALRS